MNHCKTCKFFVGGIYPLNAQLGHCKRLWITDNQPCGHTVSCWMQQGPTSDNRLEYSLPRVMDDFGCVYHSEIKKDDSPDLFRAFQRLLDYECYGLKSWFDECTKRGQAGGETQKTYQFGYNSLVSIRQRMASPEWVLQFLDKEKFDMPEAKERIFTQQ